MLSAETGLSRKLMELSLLVNNEKLFIVLVLVITFTGSAFFYTFSTTGSVFFNTFSILSTGGVLSRSGYLLVSFDFGGKIASFWGGFKFYFESFGSSFLSSGFCSVFDFVLGLISVNYFSLFSVLGLGLRVFDFSSDFWRLFDFSSIFWIAFWLYYFSL